MSSSNFGGDEGAVDRDDDSGWGLLSSAPTPERRWAEILKWPGARDSGLCTKPASRRTKRDRRVGAAHAVRHDAGSLT